MYVGFIHMYVAYIQVDYMHVDYLITYLWWFVTAAVAASNLLFEKIYKSVRYSR